MNLIDYMHAYGTSEGANKGWDTRGRGRAKKNFEPKSSVVSRRSRDIVNHYGYKFERADDDGNNTYLHPDGSKVITHIGQGWSHRSSDGKTTSGVGVDALSKVLSTSYSKKGQ